MRNLRKLFYVACVALCLSACEENYNDKLFWPGEISREYGSYIKPFTLDLTYSGEKLIGKTVTFKTEDSETGTLTLNGIIPGEINTPINNIRLIENGEKDAYTFSGTNVTMSGATVKFVGSVTPKAMKLTLDVTAAYASSFADTYTFPERSYTDPESGASRQSGAAYVNLIAAPDDFMGAMIAAILPQLVNPLLDTFLPYALQSITFEQNGNIGANYTTDPFNFNEVTKHQTATDVEFKQWINSRNYAPSPKGLAYWNKTGSNSLIVQFNVPAIINLIAQNNGQQLDPKLINGICEALFNSDPVRFKSILITLNTILNNEVIDYIANVDDETFTLLFTWIKDGITLEMSQKEEHTYISLNKQALIPILNVALPIFSDKLTELGMTPESLMKMLSSIETMNIGLDLTSNHR